MFDTILVPTDGSELSAKAVRAALEFAKRNGSRVVGLAVAEAYPYSALAEPAFLPDPIQWDRDNQALANKNAEGLAVQAREAGVPCECVVSAATDPADEIVRQANEHHCDCIFMASHGRRGLDRLLLGSVTQKVLLNSKLPVVVLR
jgi:nucleotide-binding universal stress UspA family protein